MIRQLPHIIACIHNKPLLIEHDRLMALMSGLAIVMRARGPAEIEASDEPESGEGEAARPRSYRVQRGVGIVPVRGVLVRRAGQVDSQSTPLQSYETLARTIRSARADPRVRGILLDIDSPGGEAGGVFDMTHDIRAAAQTKPVWAIANDDALSAAYAIGAAADQLWVTDTGAAGSVGAVAMHVDQSSYDEEQGLKYTYLYRGAHKVDGNPHSPISGIAMAATQDEVDRLYGMLVDDIAAHRDMSADELRRTEAAIYYGGNALERGLADRIGTLEQAHAELAERVAMPTRRTSSPSQETHMEHEPDGQPIAPIADNIIRIQEQLEAASVAAAVNERTRAGEIAALCNLARHPEMAAEYIKSNTSLAEVRDSLQRAQAADDAKRQVEVIDPTQVQKRNTHAELHAAAEARFKAQSQAVR